MYRNGLFYGSVVGSLLVLAALTVRMVMTTEALASARQRALAAYAARYEGLAEADARQRAIDAYAARWTGLAQRHQERQHWDAVGAYYAGQAITLYVQTGNPEYLPRCISARLLALLPPIGDDNWRAEVAICADS